MEKLRKLFTIWNAEYFGGLLTNVPMRTYTRRCGRMGYYKFSSRERSINVNLNQSEAAQQHTLLHEMAHAYLHARGMKHGHTPYFKAMLTSLTVKAFGFIPQGSISHVIPVPNSALALGPVQTKEVPSIPVPVLVPVPASMFTKAINRYKVLSTGKIGTFLRESNIYGKKHYVLQIEGMLFPFTTPADNVIAA